MVSIWYCALWAVIFSGMVLCRVIGNSVRYTAIMAIGCIMAYYVVRQYVNKGLFAGTVY